jgi:hypothetical protein
MKWIKIFVLSLFFACSPTKRTTTPGAVDSTTLFMFPGYDSTPHPYNERLKITLEYEKTVSPTPIRKRIPKKTLYLIGVATLITGIVVGKVLLKFL